MKQFILTYKNAIQNRLALLLLSSTLISRMGDAVHEVALVYIVYFVTKNALLMSTVAIVSIIPNLFFGPIAGAIVDKNEKLKILIQTDIIRTFLVLLIPIAFIKNFYILWIIFFVAFFSSICESLNMPAKQSFIPIIVKQDNLRSTNALFSMSTGIIIIIGNAIGSFLVSNYTITKAFYFDSLSFLLSAFFIFILIFKFRQEDTYSQYIEKVNRNKIDNKSNIFKDLKAGFKAIKENRIISNILFVSLFLNIGGAPLIILLPFYLKNIIHQPPQYMGYAISIMTAGVISGSFIFGGLKIRNGILFITGSAGVGLIFLLLAIYPFVITKLVLVAFLLLFFLMGIFMSLTNISIPTIFQIHTPKELQGRIFSASKSISVIGQPIALALNGVLIQFLGAFYSFIIGGSIILLVVLFVLFNGTLKDV